ncbi:multi-sensor signal transduction histidine kinase [Alkaliphilus metalliredigens QYMF]|uniref:histidine kinase n=1 Tax=Alkaliphilus metalliredigens (strain QYMF) TaxID=293826 RepID=A6TS47_ALKMQ|nr:ATP-binding protein [Alkaliphilus metalliredigens]ABR49015.1 multi-sensor signal transduction histidine kinase [Alkaliphilus metalliredigens QYMF]
MQKKIFGTFVILLLIGILLTGFLSLSLIRTSHMNELERRLISNAKLIESFIMEKEVDLKPAELQRIAEEYGSKAEVRVTIIDQSGEVLADSLAAEGVIENHRNRPEVQMAYEDGLGRAIRHSETVNIDMMYIAIPVQFSEENIGIVRLAINLLEIQRINERLYYYIGISIIIGLIAASILGYRFIRKIMEPIKEMTEMSNEIAKGRFDKRVRVVSNDEMGQLGDHFNDMADHLKHTISQLSQSNTKFKALLTSIINPIVAVDNKSQVILLNPAAEKLFNTTMEEAMGKHILEVIRNNLLDEQIKEIFEKNEAKQIEVTLKEPKERILKVYTNPIQLEHDPTRIIGLVALMEDVSEIRKLEKMRSEFVANVSHELKTPLTSISGFIETLKSGAIEDEETKMRFLDIIDIETERLARLINDILTLSEIENNHSHLAGQGIKTNEALKDVIEMMTPIAQNKSIRLGSQVELNLPILIGNQDWFKQMFINLIDNALKYTSEGGRVQISAYKKYNHVVFSVKDCGVGIPKKDIPRLFERFYRVDKARTRKVGGTGLGLAIVKHIVLSLNGRIKVNSEVGKGTEFILIVPIDET